MIRYTTKQKETHSDSWTSCNVWLRIFSRRRYDLIELTDFHLNWTSSYEWLNLRYRTCQQTHRRRLYVRSRFILAASILFKSPSSLFEECDAAIVSSISCAYKSDSLDAVKQWFFDIQKEVHVLGPFLPMVTASMAGAVKGQTLILRSFSEKCYLG